MTIKRWNLTSLPVALAGLLLLACPAGNGEADDQSRPDILMILADDLGYGDLSRYGATDLKTPNIDALALSGLRMDNFYANCPVCTSTRASLLIGHAPNWLECRALTAGTASPDPARRGRTVAATRTARSPDGLAAAGELRLAQSSPFC